MKFNCNSVSTIIVLIVSIKFEELTGKINSFETVDDEYYKNAFFFGFGNDTLYSCIKNTCIKNNMPLGRWRYSHTLHSGLISCVETYICLQNIRF